MKYYKIAPYVLEFVKGYDVIHIHGVGFFSDFLSITKWLHKTPIILSTHGGIFATRNINALKKVYFHIVTRLILRNFEKIIATGRNDYELFSRISGNIVLVEPCIYYENFSSIRRKPEKNTLLFVGRLSKNKRIDNLIRTVAELKRKIPDVKLYVAGNDWDGSMESLKKLSRSLGTEKNAVFLGKVSEPELKKYYSISLFFVSASEYEGFGISVAEAMAAGCVPILNNIGAFRSFVDEGKNGFVLDFSKPKEAAEIAYKVMKRKDLSRIAANAKAAAKKYDWGTITEKIVRLYEEFKSGQRVL